MARDIMANRLEQLEKQRSQLEARIRKERARANQQERKDDTRRKILIGACVMARMETNEALKNDVMAWLDKDLKREIDRQMFGLTVDASADSDQTAKGKVAKAS